jgi:hypothetical protein
VDISTRLRNILELAHTRIINLRTASRFLLTFLIGLIAAAVAFWIANKVIIYFVARSYVEEIGEVFNISKPWTSALVWITFAVTLVFVSYALSFSRRKRIVGIAGLFFLLIGHAIVLGFGHPFFDRRGKAIKCYVITRNDIRYRERPGIDPETGLPCRPVTPEIVERLHAYEKGRRPKRVDSAEPTFFDLRTGQPIVWYYKKKDDAIEIFDLMGFYPDTGEELLPVSKEVVELWKTQDAERRQNEARRAPERLDPDTAEPFDPKNGEPKIMVSTKRKRRLRVL